MGTVACIPCRDENAHMMRCQPHRYVSSASMYKVRLLILRSIGSKGCDRMGAVHYWWGFV
ncbi:hypothetical protein Hanom_Chr11g01037871 [Helianthus anomalus]